jgi:tetratricopeptide (TPR) repeat protein
MDRVREGGTVTHAFRDRWGSTVFASDQVAVGLFDEAVEQLVSLSGDPVAATEQVVAFDPELLLARALQAYLALYSTAATGFEAARSLLVDLDPWSVGRGERELLHLLAAKSWADGEWERAANHLERALLHDPNDLLALKVAQDLYFFLGDGNGLKDVVERLHRAWLPERAGYGYVCGMYAFGLEEGGLYEAAQEQARIALEMNPLDVWAVHAQAHVFEMQGEPRLGVAFLDHTENAWSSSYFSIHNWWHRALYHLELGELEEVLALYDGPIRGTRSSEWLDLADAASLLWRLHLYGVDVATRAKLLSEDIEGLVREPVYVFNDWHAVMAAGLAGNGRLSEELTLAVQSAHGGTNGRVIAEAGLDLLEGFTAFAAGAPEGAFQRLVDIRPKAHVVGGSHAQRDVIDLTLIAAAARSGNAPVADALVKERLARKPSAKKAAHELLRANQL